MVDWKSGLLWFFLLAVLPFAIYGIYAGIRDSGRVTQEIRRLLVDPYAQALAAEDDERAYWTFTSAAFRQVYSLDDYLAAQAANRAEFGPLLSLTIRETESFRGARELFGGRSFHRGGLLYRGTLGDTWLQWEVVQDHGVPKLDASFQEFHRMLSPRVF